MRSKHPSIDFRVMVSNSLELKTAAIMILAYTPINEAVNFCAIVVVVVVFSIVRFPIFYHFNSNEIGDRWVFGDSERWNEWV